MHMLNLKGLSTDFYWNSAVNCLPLKSSCSLTLSQCSTHHSLLFDCLTLKYLRTAGQKLSAPGDLLLLVWSSDPYSFLSLILSAVNMDAKKTNKQTRHLYQDNNNKNTKKSPTDLNNEIRQPTNQKNHKK